jgi:hypothetical protein
MSNEPRRQPRLPVVVPPVVTADASMKPLRAVPIWIASAVAHALLLVLFSLVTYSNSQAEPPATVEIITTAVENVEDDQLTINTEIGTDPGKMFNPDLPLKDDIAVDNLPDPFGKIGRRDGMDLELIVPPPPGSGLGDGGRDGEGPGSSWKFGPEGGDGGLRASSLLGLRGTSGEARRDVVSKNGGNELSEAAVSRGLEWLALHQASDGHWSMHEFNRHAREKPLPAGKTFTCNCQPGTGRHNDIAATGFGLLPFLGYGITHRPGDRKDSVDYSKSVAAGLKYLRDKQGADGYYGGDMYAHAIAAIAMCEAYGLTSDPQLKASAQKAMDYIVYAQDPVGGGWRYTPRTEGDTSVTGWELMAIKSGQMAGLKVPNETLKKVERYLDSVESSKKGGYSYMPNSGETAAMTAVGLLCRQYLGVNPKNPDLVDGVERLKKTPPGKSSLYYEYYATQVMHHMGGDSWQFWNLGPNGDGKGGIRDTMIKRQDSGSDTKHVHQRGSFAGEGISSDGRIMSTSLSLLTLEVYYRHLPLYRRGEVGMTKEEKK